MDVGPLTVAVADHDQLGNSAGRRKSMRGHRRELGGLAGLDDQPPVTQ
jgi:hypothetical protein